MTGSAFLPPSSDHSLIIHRNNHVPMTWLQCFSWSKLNTTGHYRNKLQKYQYYNIFWTSHSHVAWESFCQTVIEYLWMIMDVSNVIKRVCQKLSKDIFHSLSVLKVVDCHESDGFLHTSSWFSWHSWVWVSTTPQKAWWVIPNFEVNGQVFAGPDWIPSDPQIDVHPHLATG